VTNKRKWNPVILNIIYNLRIYCIIVTCDIRFKWCVKFKIIHAPCIRYIVHIIPRKYTDNWQVSKVHYHKRYILLHVSARDCHLQGDSYTYTFLCILISLKNILSSRNMYDSIYSVILQFKYLSTVSAFCWNYMNNVSNSARLNLWSSSILSAWKITIISITCVSGCCVVYKETERKICTIMYVMLVTCFKRRIMQRCVCIVYWAFQKQICKVSP
jgi:hypothetical protein